MTERFDDLRDPRMNDAQWAELQGDYKLAVQNITSLILGEEAALEFTEEPEENFPYFDHLLRLEAYDPDILDDVLGEFHAIRHDRLQTGQSSSARRVPIARRVGSVIRRRLRHER